MPSPEHQMLVDLLRAQPVIAPSVAEMRANLEAMAQSFTLPADVRCEKVSADGVPAEWVSAPGASADRAVLYLHGGGYVIGSINTHRELAARISRTSGARVLVLDYRLAPENPFPAAVEDATKAYRWILARGIAAQKVVVAGDSAGGGLTIATLVALRDQKTALPAGGVCISPWTDLEGTGESIAAKAAEDPMVKNDGLVAFARHYLNGQDPRSPLAAPLYADLSGLPPLYILVGTAEILLDDASRVAERARKAGVSVTYEPWDGLVHVFPLFPQIPEAKQATDKIGAFIRERIA